MSTSNKQDVKDKPKSEDEYDDDDDDISTPEATKMSEGPGPELPPTPAPPSLPPPPPQPMANPLMIRKLSRDLEPGLRQPPPPPPDPEPVRVKWWKHFYDRDKKTFCDRTCTSWIHIVTYSIMYIIFLSTYTMIFLYGSLCIIKSQETYMEKSKLSFFTSGIGLTATPLAEFSHSMIWYTKEDHQTYEKYVNAIDRIVSRRRKRDANVNRILGPCSKAPFGYGEAPCIIVRINKQWGWSARPLRSGFSAEVPTKVQQWSRKDAKLWLHCSGYHPYDVEHIGSIKYYPDPPGFDPGFFPLNSTKDSPLIGVQFFNFTVGISIAVECKLWYEDGSSSVEFVIYVDSSRKIRV